MLKNKGATSMKKFIKIISLVLLVMMLFSTVGCDRSAKYGEWYRKENETANQDYLFGMCGIFEAHSTDNPNFSWDVAIDLCKNLGVKSIRTWLRFRYVMDTDMNIIEEEAAKYHAHFAQQKEYGIQTIAMCQNNLQPDGTFGTTKPARDLSEGSTYMKWLENFEECWYRLVKEFPEVEYWEIENESNNTTFMEKFGGGSFSTLEMAQITADMLFFASRGIHRANPEAITVMGGIVMWNAVDFLNMVYDEIYDKSSWSQKPDDYFQVACWHPYNTTLSARTIDKWVQQQKDVYAVVKKREGKDKKVFFTEFGWSDLETSAAAKQTALELVYTKIQEELPFVEAAHYFRMFDRSAQTFGSTKEKKFGIFNDPLNLMIGQKPDVYLLGAPKEIAYLYQRLAGGTGDLTIMQKWAAENAQK